MEIARMEIVRMEIVRMEIARMEIARMEITRMGRTRMERKGTKNPSGCGWISEFKGPIRPGCRPECVPGAGVSHDHPGSGMGYFRTRSM